MEEDTLLYLQLHKLAPIKSQEDLQFILETLWKTRRTGLSLDVKSSIQSILNFHSPDEVDPVSACLRSLIRKCVHGNLNGDDILKLFPPDLSLELQSILGLLLQKFQSQWKEEMSTEQNLLPRSGVSHQVISGAGLLPSFMSVTSSELFASLWPRQDDPITHSGRNDFGASIPITTETNASHSAQIPLRLDAGPNDNLGILPRLKSMTWTLENRSRAPPYRVAVITLKLQDYTKSPSGEMEVKFQLTRDTLEAMLRSMTYISERLSNLTRQTKKKYTQTHFWTKLH
ncbi:hypothetical protein NMG60_11031140 [Bertholletia excelsa]